MDINAVALVGRLTRDAELRYTTAGSAVANISIAINSRKKRDDQWVDEAHFFDAVIWGQTAESLSPYLVKGKQVGIQGELRQNRWQDQQSGQNRSKVEIFVRNLQLLGGGQGNSQGDSQGDSNYAGSTPGPKATTAASDPDGGASDIPSYEDDIPF